MIHKTTRSILSVLLAALLLVTSVPLTPAFAGGGGAVSPQSESAEGRALEPANDGKYYISTAEQLKEFANKVNDDSGQYTDIDAELTADIDLSEICGENIGGQSVSWTPIGSDSRPYRGTFNGAGHTISGLYINSSSDSYQGLFGYLSTDGDSTDGDNTGTVKDLSVSGSVSGFLYVGGVVGSNSNGSVEDCAFSGSVSGLSAVGGVVGWNGGSVENCYNTGSVTSRDSPVGGVVGYNDIGATVTNCYNTGTVTGSDSPLGGVGGVVGYNYRGGSVTNSYNTGEVSGKIRVGGVVGLNDGGSVTGCYFLKQDGLSGGPTGATVVNDLNELCKALEDSDTWTISPFYKHPVLQANPEGGLGTATHPYEIKTAAQLETFRYLVNNGIEKSAHAKLMNDIDLNPGITFNADGTYFSPDGEEPHQWTPIGNSIGNSYRGTFDGNGKTISGLYIDSDADYQGLFGYVSGSGKVQNLSVSGSVKGNDYVGGVVGQNSGSVENCYNTGTVTGTYSYVGGVVGYNSGPVKNCYNTGNISGKISGEAYGNTSGGVVGYNSGSVENCYNTGAVNISGNISIGTSGGVVGGNGGTVENCYNTGNISGGVSGGVVGYNISSVTNCYNTGDVSGNSVGGVVGWNSDSVTNCYNIGDVSYGAYTGGVVGWNDGANVTNCYFLQTADVNKDLPGIGFGGEGQEAIQKTADAFHSGEVAWRLQNGQADGSSQVWGQNIKDGIKYNYPQLRAFDADTPQVYKVAFMNDSEEHDAKYANSGMTVTPPEEPKKTDHLFGGWFNNGELTGDPVTGPISVNSDTTYYAKWTPFSYTLSATPDTLNFGSITEGEERPAAQTVTVKNTGNQTVTLNQPTATNFEITTSDNLTLNAGESVTLTIQPKDKLPRGSYSEQITITGDNNVSETLTATFTVKEPPYSGKYSYEVFTSVGDNGAISVDRYATEGDKVTIDVTPDQAYKLDELVVTANGKDVELTANSDGTYTFTMPSADVRITATFAEDPDWTEPEEPATDVSDLFIDIAPDAWYKDAVQYAYDNGLMTGVSATEFAPEQTTTRAMIVSILARLENVTTAEAAGFADVDDNEWYATAVNWAASVGVVNGYEDNTFKPNTAITREQLAAILMNYAAYKGEDVSNRADLTSYTDQPSTWAEEAISWSVAEGLLTGVTADTLQPQGAATRAQVAAILQRFLSE